MARPLRIQYPNAWYHVMNRGRRGESVFRELSDYHGFIALLKEVVDMWAVRVAAYCLMPNHYHLLIQTPQPNLARCMRHINGVYTQRFNRSHSYDGQLFRGRYKCILVEADSYLLELLRYIHRNPLKAGLVERLDRYSWSSHRAYLADAKKWDWLYKGFVLSMFSRDVAESRRRYRSFISEESPAKVSQVLGKKKWPSVLGSKGFLDWVKGRFFDQKRHEEVPESRSLAPDIERIKKAVCNLYGVDLGFLNASRRGISNEPRNMAIYLTRRLRGDSLEEIAIEFKISKYSSVSTIVGRMNNKLSEDGRLRKRFLKLEEQLKMSQEQT